ncbi:TIGR03118 family protein [Caballeronia sp. KNU42]
MKRTPASRRQLHQACCDRRRFEFAVGRGACPANFGAASNGLLAGNFGDGTINVFDPNTGAFIGALTQTDGTIFKQTGLRGIAFGNNVDNQPLNTLFFAAGPTPTSGVYGRLDLMP